MARQIKDKYYICPRCARLTTQSELLKSAENCGDIGMCYCRFDRAFWNEDYNDLDVETLREFQPYTEISKKWFDRLSLEKNDVIRLDMFNQIPKDKLMED